jgi:hypothetical protein
MFADPSNPNTFYCAGWYYDTSYYRMGFGKSTDGGVTWTHSMVSAVGATAYPYSMGIDPTHPDTLFIGGYEGSSGAIYRSTDGGSTWTKLGAAGLTSQVFCIAVRPDNPSVIFAGTGGGIYRSTDSGSTFTRMSTTINYTKDVLIDPSNPNRIWVGTYSQGVYQSTDGGTTWTAMNTGLGGMCVNRLGVNPNSCLFAGTDGSATYRWSLAVGVGDEQTAPLAVPALYAMPNPVQTGASIHYSVTGTEPISITIYDLQGRVVGTLDAEQGPGDHEAWWSAEGVTPGVYFMRLVSGSEIQTGRLVVAR